MIIELLHLIGFGKFRQRELAFAPGMNLVYGKNESGKTTLQRFIEFMLYGVKKDGLTRRLYMDEYDLFKPWQGEEYEGRLVFALDSGKRLEVFRRFDKSDEKVTIHDLLLGKDISRDFETDRRGETLFAGELLGVTRSAFLNSAMVGQLALAEAFSGTADLSTALMRAAGGRTGDEGAARALDQLKRALDQVGKTDRAKRSGELVAKLRDLESRHREAVEYRLKLNYHKERLHKVQQELKRNEASALAIQKRISACKAENIAALLANVKNVQEKIEHHKKALERYTDYIDFDHELKNEVQLLEERKAAFEASIGKVRERADKLKGDIEEIENCMSELAPFAELSPDVGEEMIELRTQWKQSKENYQLLKSQIDAEMAKGEERLLKYEELKELFEKLGEDAGKKVGQLNEEEEKISNRLIELSDKAGKAIWSHSSYRAVSVGIGLLAAGCTFATGLLVVLSLLGFDSGLALPILAGVTVLALVAVLVVRRRGRLAGHEGRQTSQQYEDLRQRRKEVREERRTILSISGVSNVQELIEKRAAFDALENSLEGSYVLLQQKRLPQLESELQKVESRIQFLLGSVGLAGKHSPKDGQIRTFLDFFKETQGLKDRHKERVGQYEETNRELKNTQKEMDAAVKRLSEIYTDSEVRGFTEFIERSEGKRSYLRHKGELDRYQETLDGLLAGRKIESLERELAEARRFVDEEVGEQIPLDEENLLAMEKELAKLRDRIGEDKSERDQLLGIIETMQGGHVDPGLLELEIEQSNDELEAIRRRREALNLAISGIEEATEKMHSDFAPELNKAVSKYADALTGGRYGEVMVSDDFEVAVRAPESSGIVGLDVLSGGTRDQVIFATRLAAADTLSAAREGLPLILDDSFVEYDEPRAEAAMQVLGELAKKRQVILFTCHSRECELARELLSETFNLIELDSNA